MHLGTINHPEPIIDRKVKHFYDHLRYLLSPNRDLSSYPIENHLTLLERIQFKIDNPVLYPSSIKVITKYLNDNLLYNTRTDFFSKDKKIRDLLLFLKSANSKKDIDANFKNHLLSLVKSLNGLEKFNGDKYFRSVLSELVKCLGSKKLIKIERTKIEYFANLLLAEFLRVGFHWDDFTNIGGMMDRILSNELQINDGMENNFYSVFPLPLDIENHRGKDGFKEIVEDFLKNRTFAQQFEGLYNFYSEKRNGLFLFRIYNVFEHWKDFSFEHNGVTIFHRNQLEVNKSTWNESYIEKFNEFVNKENTLLATVPLSYKSHKYAIQTAIFKTREAIDFLNFVSKEKNKNYNGAILGTRQVYTIFDEGNYIKGLWQADKVRTRNKKVEQVINYFYPKGFELLDSNIQKTIRQNDKIIFRAKATIYWDEKVNNYWRYLDGVLGFGLGKIDGKDIVKKASRLILLTEENFKKQRLEFTIANALSNSDKTMIKLNISPMELMGKINKVNKNEFQVLDLKGVSDYPFINEKFKEHESYKVDYLAVCNFYQTLFGEAYEQRNMAFHQNKFCFSTSEKLINYLPDIINRLREVIVDELISNKNLSIQESIESLYQKGSLLINQ